MIMKKNYPIKKQLFSIGISVTLMLIASLLPNSFKAQQSYTFTSCGASGASGPTQTQANSTYSTGNSLNGSVTIVGSGIQQFTVPTTGLYKIETRGASGYPYGQGGRGAIIYGEFNFTAGNVLKIVVGQAGQVNPASGTLQFGGGGGSFVALLNNTPLNVAGGGGGSHATTYTPSTADGTVSTTGNTASGSTAGTGGTGGSGGAASSSANGGAGFYGDGGGTTGVALSFTNGAVGGNVGAIAYANGGIGGFGGGGGTQSWNNNRGGGGGGYSGGGGGQLGQPSCWGGGGGSFNSGTNQLNTSGANTFSDGLVIITEACNLSLIASGSNSVSPSICSGQSVTLTTNGVSNYNWSNGNTSSNTIAVSPTITTVYTLSATSPSACTAVRSITVLVSNGQPTLSVISSTNQVCLGKTVTLTATGAMTYTWSNGILNGASYLPSATQVYTVSGQNACGTSTAQTSVTVAPLSVTAITSNSSVCAGQICTLTAVSAVSGFTWQPFAYTGATVLTSPNVNTIYTVTASDGTCSGTATISVNALPIPTITAASTSTNLCAGASATLTATGAVAYVWQPGNLTGNSIVVSPIIPTFYTVTGVASNSCFASTNQIIIANPSPTLVISSSDPIICIGSSATLSINGASTYTWNNNANTSSLSVSPIQTTVYSVIGQNATTSCTSTSSITVNVFNPTLSITGNTAVCLGSTATLQASGANTYQWSNGITGANNSINPTTNTIISVTALTSSGSINCPSSGTVQIVVKPNPTVLLSSTNGTICKGENASVSASGAQSYTWNTGATTTSISVTSSLVTTANYSVNATSSLGCLGSGTIAVKINACTDIQNFSLNAIEFNAFPNPNQGSFIISANSEIKICIYNELGQLLENRILNKENNFKLELNNFLPGVYIMQVNDGLYSLTKKIIVSE